MLGNTEKKTEKRWKANPHRGIATSDKVFAVICKKKEKRKKETKNKRWVICYANSQNITK